jgi:integrase
MGFGSGRVKLLKAKPRRGVRVVEGARLESVCWGNSTVGSNPTLSAISNTFPHTLRKTAATNWLRAGFYLMKITTWLGHKSLEVTQIYIESEMHDPEEQEKLDRAGQF